jgi:hypothetical protein
MEANMANLRTQVEKDIAGRYSLANFTGTQASLHHNTQTSYSHIYIAIS